MQTIILKNEDLDPTEMREILEFRSQIFEEVYQLASEKPDSYSPKRPDKYDKYSVHFILRDEDGIIRAYARLIVCQATELPIAEACTIPTNARTPVAGVSRLCLCKSYRGDLSGFSLLSVLFVEMATYSLANGITDWYCLFLNKFYYAARKLFKLPLQRLGEPVKFSENTYAHPCLVDVVGTVARNHSKVYGQYMLSKLENPSKFDRRRLQFFGRLMAQKLAA